MALGQAYKSYLEKLLKFKSELFALSIFLTEISMQFLIY